jgi:hypothetical protein
MLLGAYVQVSAALLTGYFDFTETSDIHVPQRHICARPFKAKGEASHFFCHDTPFLTWLSTRISKLVVTKNWGCMLTAANNSVMQPPETSHTDR